MPTQNKSAIHKATENIQSANHTSAENKMNLDEDKGHIEPSKMSTINQTIDLLTKIVGLITWPLLIIVMLLIFYSPIKRIANTLPEKFERSNEISVGSLSLKIQQQAKAEGNEELAAIIKGLSKGAIRELIDVGYKFIRIIAIDNTRSSEMRRYSLAPSFSTWKELATNGLLESDLDLKDFEDYFNSLNPHNGIVEGSTLSQEQREKLEKSQVKLSNRGKRAYDIVVNVVADQIANER